MHGLLRFAIVSVYGPLLPPQQDTKNTDVPVVLPTTTSTRISLTGMRELTLAETRLYEESPCWIRNTQRQNPDYHVDCTACSRFLGSVSFFKACRPDKLRIIYLLSAADIFLILQWCQWISYGVTCVAIQHSARVS